MVSQPDLGRRRAWARAAAYSWGNWSTWTSTAGTSHSIQFLEVECGQRLHREDVAQHDEAGQLCGRTGANPGVRVASSGAMRPRHDTKATSIRSRNASTTASLDRLVLQPQILVV
ncbi:hypothetical protein OHA71_02690 [Streptomyces sp. NBC_00444]|uniref:hypothetical protein n=1 Tax=Streptomyces sp. NBC_00444 TaxID=2975744 RepID=UPI002E1F85C5